MVIGTRQQVNEPSQQQNGGPLQSWWAPSATTSPPSELLALVRRGPPRNNTLALNRDEMARAAVWLMLLPRAGAGGGGEGDEEEPQPPVQPGVDRVWLYDYSSRPASCTSASTGQNVSNTVCFVDVVPESCPREVALYRYDVGGGGVSIPCDGDDGVDLRSWMVAAGVPPRGEQARDDLSELLSTRRSTRGPEPAPAPARGEGSRWRDLATVLAFHSGLNLK